MSSCANHKFFIFLRLVPKFFWFIIFEIFHHFQKWPSSRGNPGFLKIIFGALKRWAAAIEQLLIEIPSIGIRCLIKWGSFASVWIWNQGLEAVIFRTHKIWSKLKNFWNPDLEAVVLHQQKIGLNLKIGFNCGQKAENWEAVL